MWRKSYCPCSSSKHVSERLICGVLEAIGHHGPNDEGVDIDKALMLGIRRLIVIDLLSGEQPVYGEERSVVVLNEKRMTIGGR